MSMLVLRAARDGLMLNTHLMPEARIIVALEGADGLRIVGNVLGEDFAFGIT